MKKSVEEQIENEMNEIITDVHILKAVIQNLHDGIHDLKNVYKDEMESLTTLLERQIRILAGKCSKVNEKIYKYLYKKYNL